MFLVAAVAMLVLAGSIPLSSRARAQTFFGAQRFPAIDVDTADNLYLMMSVATAPASEHTTAQPDLLHYVAQRGC